MDFLVEGAKGASPIEVKSGRDFRSHRALDNVLAVGEYRLSGARVLCVSPTVERGRISYLPVYATMFIRRDPLPDKWIYKV